MEKALRQPLTSRTFHLCIDMQRLFALGGPWATPWMPRVLPVVQEMVGFAPERAIFAHFVPPMRPEDLPGQWQRYYRRWRNVTREFLDHSMLQLMPELERFVPPAHVIKRDRYSVFTARSLLPLLQECRADGLIITGAETDVCVLATTLDAVDLGFRVIVVSDGICSSSDQGHDALMDLYQRRFSEQIEVADAASILSAWPRG